MSAFIVTKEHIDAICSIENHFVTPYARCRRRYAANETELGKMLWRENARSVAYRCDDKHPYNVEGYTFKPYMFRHNEHVKAFKILDCLEYQSCESPDWEDSQAFRFVQELRGALIRSIPGYDAAPWGIERDNKAA